jgi:hypothetical protein
MNEFYSIRKKDFTNRFCFYGVSLGWDFWKFLKINGQILRKLQVKILEVDFLRNKVKEKRNGNF